MVGGNVGGRQVIAYEGGKAEWGIFMRVVPLRRVRFQYVTHQLSLIKETYSPPNSTCYPDSLLFGMITEPPV